MDENYILLTKEEKANKAMTYLLPMIFTSYKKTHWNSLVNVYLSDDSVKDLDKGFVFLLYRISNDPGFKDFEKSLGKHESMELTYDVEYEGNSYAMYVFRIPSQYKQEYESFMVGKYSEFSDQYKKKILAFYDLDQHHAVADVLYKREKLYLELEERLKAKVPRTLDPSDIYDEKYEVFRKNKLN